MKTLVLLAVAMIGAPTCRASTWISATAVGDSVTITVQFSARYEQDTTGHHLIVIAERLGVCADPEVVTAAPMAMPPPDLGLTYRFTVPSPDPTRIVKYRAVGVDPDGAWYALSGGPAPDVSTYVRPPGCPVARGYLWDTDGFLSFEPCAAECWRAVSAGYATCTPGTRHAQPGYEAFVNTGQLVEIYGWIVVSDMGWNCVDISSVVAAVDPGACRPVPVAAVSWGELKAMYR